MIDKIYCIKCEQKTYWEHDESTGEWWCGKCLSDEGAELNVLEFSPIRNQSSTLVESVIRCKHEINEATKCRKH